MESIVSIQKYFDNNEFDSAIEDRKEFLTQFVKKRPELASKVVELLLKKHRILEKEFAEIQKNIDLNKGFNQNMSMLYQRQSAISFVFEGVAKATGSDVWGKV